MNFGSAPSTGRASYTGNEHSTAGMCIAGRCYMDACNPVMRWMIIGLVQAYAKGPNGKILPYKKIVSIGQAPPRNRRRKGTLPPWLACMASWPLCQSLIRAREKETHSPYNFIRCVLSKESQSRHSHSPGHPRSNLRRLHPRWTLHFQSDIKAVIGQISLPRTACLSGHPHRLVKISSFSLSKRKKKTEERSNLPSWEKSRRQKQEGRKTTGKPRPQEWSRDRSKSKRKASKGSKDSTHNHAKKYKGKSIFII